MIREANDLINVAGLESMQRVFNGRLRLLEGPSRHAARTIEHEDQFQRLPANILQVPRRIQHQREITAAFVATGEKARFDRFTGDAIAQHKIPVGNPVGAVQPGHKTSRRDVFLPDAVGPADRLFDGKAGVHLERERDILAAPLLRRQVLRLGWLPGNAALCAGDRANAGGRAGGIETRPDNHREDEFIPAIHEIKRVKIFDVNVDCPAWLDVRDRLREDVGPFLGQQRGDVAPFLGFLINPLRFPPLADNAANTSFADRHYELVD